MKKQKKRKTDVRVENHGSVFLFRCLTEAARVWINTNVQADALWWHGALAVEPRYAFDLADGMIGAGLQVVEGSQ